MPWRAKTSKFFSNAFSALHLKDQKKEATSGTASNVHQVATRASNSDEPPPRISLQDRLAQKAGTSSRDEVRRADEVSGRNETSPSIKATSSDPFVTSGMPALKKQDLSSPDALIEISAGKWAPMKMSAKDAKAWLNDIFDTPEREKADQAPGEMSALLQQLEDDDVLSAEVVCAIASARSATGEDRSTSRPLAEAAMVAQWQTGFMFSSDKTVQHNIDAGTIPPRPDYSSHRKMAKAELNVYWNAKDILPEDSVMVFGAGNGDFPIYLKEYGVKDIAAIDPMIKQNIADIAKAKNQKGKSIKPSRLDKLGKILPMTGDRYAMEHKGNKFSLVIASNFHPRTPPGLDDKLTLKRTLVSMAKMTEKGGRTIIGIPGTNPDLVTLILQSDLSERAFKSVTYHPFSSRPGFTNYRDVNGQIGFLEFRDPRA